MYKGGESTLWYVGVFDLDVSGKLKLYSITLIIIVLLATISIRGGVVSILAVMCASVTVWHISNKYHRSIELDLKEQLIDEVKRVNACEERFDDVIEYSTDVSHFRDVFDEATQFIAVFSLEGTLLYANKTICEFAGVDENELVGKPYWELPWLIHSEELQNKMVFSFEQAFRGEPVRFEAKYLDSKKNENEIDFVVKPIIGEKEEVNLLIAMGYNITDLVHTREALTEKERQMNALFEFAMDGHFFYMMPEPVVQDLVSAEEMHSLADYHNFTRWNKTFLGHFGIEDQSLKALNIADVLSLSEDVVRNICEQIIISGKFYSKVVVKDKVSHIDKIIEVVIMAIKNGKGEYTGCFGVTRDITEQKEYEHKLEYLAHKDALTGLDNRRSFFDKTQKILLDSTACPVVVMADIDRFKLVNDTYGHDVGDMVLKKVAEEIEMVVGESGFVSRYGGEEFVAVLPTYSVSDVQKIAEKIRINIENLKIKVNTEEKNNQIKNLDESQTKNTIISVTISSGIAHVLPLENNIEGAITRADSALYEAKRAGRNCVKVYVKS